MGGSALSVFSVFSSCTQLDPVMPVQPKFMVRGASLREERDGSFKVRHVRLLSSAPFFPCSFCRNNDTPAAARVFSSTPPVF